MERLDGWKPLIDQTCTLAKILYYEEQGDLYNEELHSTDASLDISEPIIDRMREFDSYEQFPEYDLYIESESPQLCEGINTSQIAQIEDLSYYLEDYQIQLGSLFESESYCKNTLLSVADEKELSFNRF